MRSATAPTTSVDAGSDWDISTEAAANLKDCFRRTPEWHTVDEMTFDQASDLLDFLENQSITQRELTLNSNGFLTLRWLS